MKLKQIIKMVFAATAAMSVASLAQAAEVEVLHYWTSGGEAKSVAELKKIVESKGVTWKDFAVAGGAGENAATALKARVIEPSAGEGGSRAIGQRRVRTSERGAVEMATSQVGIAEVRVAEIRATQVSTVERRVREQAAR